MYLEELVKEFVEMFWDVIRRISHIVCRLLSSIFLLSKIYNFLTICIYILRGCSKKGKKEVPLEPRKKCIQPSLVSPSDSALNWSEAYKTISSHSSSGSPAAAVTAAYLQHQFQIQLQFHFSIEAFFASNFVVLFFLLFLYYLSLLNYWQGKKEEN